MNEVVLIVRMNDVQDLTTGLRAISGPNGYRRLQCGPFVLSRHDETIFIIRENPSSRVGLCDDCTIAREHERSGD